jgi:hypothetical protein
MAGELVRDCARRDAVAGEVEEAFLPHLMSELLAALPELGTNRRTNRHRGRRSLRSTFHCDLHWPLARASFNRASGQL